MSDTQPRELTREPVHEQTVDGYGTVRVLPLDAHRALAAGAKRIGIAVHYPTCAASWRSSRDMQRMRSRL